MRLTPLLISLWLVLPSFAHAQFIRLGSGNIQSANCSAETGGSTAQICQQTGDDTFHVCETGPCEASGWIPYGGGGGGGGDSVFVSGAATTDPDFRSEGDIKPTRCTAPSTPDARCVGSEDVLLDVGPNTIVASDFADDDWGDIIVSSNQATLDIDTVGLPELIACTGTPDQVVEYDAAGVPSCVVIPVEDNDLEGTVPTSILDDEIFIGTGGGTGTFVAIQNCDDTSSKLDWTGSAFACIADQTSAGGNDSVFIDGGAATDPDFRSDGDLDAIQCTDAALPDASCVAAEDVLFRYNDDSITVAKFADELWGEVRVTTNSVTIEPNVVSKDDILYETLSHATNDITLLGEECYFTKGATGGIICEGSSVDANETLLTFGDPALDIILTFPETTTNIVGDNVTQTLSFKTVDGQDAASGTTRPSGGNIIQIVSHNTGCNTLTGFLRGEACFQEDNNTMWICEPSVGDCDTPGEWTLLTSAGAFTDSGTEIVQIDDTLSVFMGQNLGADGISGTVEIRALATAGDIPQLVIEGDATQTDSVVIVQNAANTQLFNIDNDGAVLAQRLLDIDGPGTSWQVEADGDADFTSITLSGDLVNPEITKSGNSLIFDLDTNGSPGITFTETSIDIPATSIDGQEINLKEDTTHGTDTWKINLDQTDLASDFEIIPGTDGKLAGTGLITQDTITPIEIDMTDSYTWTGDDDHGSGNFEIPNGTATPTAGDCDVAGEAGRVYYDSDETVGDGMYVCDGTSWVDFVTGGGSSEWTDTGADGILSATEADDEVVIGGATPLNGGAAKLSIDGDVASEATLVVQGAAAQSADFLVVEDSAGADLMVFSVNAGDGFDLNFESGTQTYPLIGQEAVPTTTDCDEASEAGRLIIDTDLETNGSLMICGGTAGWQEVDNDGAAGSSLTTEIDAGVESSGTTVYDWQSADFAITEPSTNEFQMELANTTRSMYWGAGALSADSAECSDPAEVPAIGGAGGMKMFTAVCPLAGVDLDGFLHGSTVMPLGWVPATALTFEITARTHDDPGATEIMQGVINARCYSDDEAVTATWTANVGLDVTWLDGHIQWDTEKVLSAGITPDGSCAAGDELQWRYKVCDISGTPSAGCANSTHDLVNTHIVGFKMNYEYDESAN